LFIIAIGALLLTNTMSLIAIWAFKNGYYIESFAAYAAAPTYLTAILAGLLSFLSPCVAARTSLPGLPERTCHAKGVRMKKIFLILLAAIVLAACQSKPVVGETVTIAGGSYKNVSAYELNMMLKEKDFVFVNVHIPFAGDIANRSVHSLQPDRRA
jgi:predicted small secreted protein